MSTIAATSSQAQSQSHINAQAAYFEAVTNPTVDPELEAYFDKAIKYQETQDAIDVMCGIEPGSTSEGQPLKEAIRKMRETNPAFTAGWLLDDYDRKRLQAAAYEDVYYTSIRTDLKKLDLQEDRTNTIERGSNTTIISRAILHGILSELCQAPEAWKSIPSRYILKDVAMKETGMPINMGWACRTANVLAQCVHDRFGGGWHIIASFSAAGVCESSSVQLTAERQDAHTEIVLDELFLSEIEEGLRENFLKSALFGAFKAGAKDVSKCSGAISTPHGTVLIDVADAVEPDSFSAMWL